VRVRRVEVLFVLAPIVLIGALLFSMADTSKKVGAKLGGHIRQCSGRRRGPRSCTVDIDSHTSVEIDSLFGRAGDHVTVVKMQKTISGTTYYVATIAGDP
jgi:hypothetical protein